MSGGVLALVIAAVQECKLIYEDVQFSNENCKNLLKRCLDVSYPVNQINDNKDLLLNANSAALSSVLTLLIDCRNFCNKYRKRNLFNTLTHHNRDKDNFVNYHRRLDSAVAAFNLQLTAALSINMAEMERKARADREVTNQMLMQLLQASGRQKEFMLLPQNERKGFLERAQMMSSNLMDLSQMDVDDLDGENSPTPSKKMAGGTSRQTKMSVLNSLVQDIDFALLKYWDPNNPSRIDPARILGQGSFGVVYRCEYQGKQIALKHFSCLTDTKVKPTAKELRVIQKEACTLQYCATHRNVIGFYGVSMEKGILLMELAVCSLYDLLYGGKDLTATLPRGIDIAYLDTFSYKASIVFDISSALYFLHFHNIMHRDIKSCNVVMVPEPVVSSGSVSPRQTVALVPKLSDFGLATAVGTSTNTNSSGNAAVGSTPYMAPEILNYSTPHAVYSPAVDIYALGVLANEIFTRAVPWKGAKDGQIIAQVCFQKARPTLFAPTVTDLLAYRVAQEVIGDATKGCLHQEPLKRPTSRHLSYDVDLLRQASIPVVSAEKYGKVENGTQAVNTPSRMEEQKFKEMLSNVFEKGSAVSERSAFYQQLNENFRDELTNFEVFACESTDVLDDLNYTNSPDVLITKIMVPLHQITHQYVVNKLKDKVYVTEPSLLLQEIECLGDNEIKRLMISMGSVVNELHTGLISAAEQGSITDDEHSMRVPGLIRTMLRLHALAAISEPRCCLLPVPGENIQYRKNTYIEILSPGAKNHGQIKEGDLVQVARCGLYIAGPTDETTLATRPLFASMVRRLVVLQRPPSRFWLGPSEVRGEVETSFINFESFAFDAIDTLEDLHNSNAADLFVAGVMSPMHQVTLRFVTDKLKEPKYATQANQIIFDIQDLDDSAIYAIMDKLPQKVKELSTAMSNAAAKGCIADGEHSLRIPTLVRHLLKLHAMAALCEPKCELTPVPGYRLPYKSTHHKEILSPGAKNHGHIKDGDLVEVVLCGVNFETTSSDTDNRPAIPCLVRRLLASVSKETSKNVAVSQADVKIEFVAAFQNLDPFSNDAVNCLEDIGHDDNAADLFVMDVMGPLYRFTQKYVNDRVAAKTLCLQDIESLDAGAIDIILQSFGPTAINLHTEMLEAAAQNRIDAGPQNLRLPGLVRVMLKLHALAALSEPRCYLQPAPGIRQSYRDGYHAEVLSPGSKRHGRIQENDLVEVVLCGLYYEAPANANAKPIVPSMVRRLLNSAR